MPATIDRSQQVIARGLGDPAPYLLPEETVVVGVRRHIMVMAAAFLETLGFIAGAFMIQLLVPYVPTVEAITLLIVLGALVRLAYLVLEWRMERFVITTQRALLVHGVITRHVAAMPLRKVTDLTFEKPLIGQIFGYGTFVVESAGQDQAMSRIEFLPHANRLYLKVSDLLFGGSSPVIEPDLLTDPPVDHPQGDLDDLARTDPDLGTRLAGMDLEPFPPEDGPVTGRLVVPAGPHADSIIHEPSDAGRRLKQRLAGVNGRGTRRAGAPPADGPIRDHRPL
ncbi:PH domain-containing protein [Blastococcus sp. Marseille-P5729]|uniref:PH domain-containing protein n=1 Tax=Blastococcus sp. Marseille-P5729 TaxID=2086582 RepID=UPI000D10A3C2|nr:PH domain-containing protein [Blastococcus sp. Marseille-P5729]